MSDSQNLWPQILLVDDDSQALESTKKILEFSQYQVHTAADGQSALDLVRSRKFDLVVTDVRMPRMSGIEFFRALKICSESTPVILMTAYGKVEEAVWAMKWGAVDFLMKPFKRQTLLSAIEAAMKRNQRQKPPGFDSPTGSDLPDLNHQLIGQSPALLALKDLVSRVAETEATLLLVGASGTGKELISRCVHQQSKRAQGPFVALNCAAIPDQLIESELFGYEKGAFSGADQDKPGLFEVADQGTLLLDEIGDMPLHLQAKLLRVLQEGEVRRLGATQSKKVSVRLIAATHQNLREKAKTGGFREDLLYRLEVVTLGVPSLADRKTDIPLLATYFLNKFCSKHGKLIQGFSDEAMRLLLCHSWPGNVRELANAVERSVIFCLGQEIQDVDLPAHLSHGLSLDPLVYQTMHHAGPNISVPLGTSLKEMEELMIQKTLEATAGDKSMTTKILGINSRTIYRRLEKKEDKA